MFQPSSAINQEGFEPRCHWLLCLCSNKFDFWIRSPNNFWSI